MNDGSPAHTIVIEAGRAESNYWRDLWRFRELFLLLGWRDVLVRYKQTALGIAWAVLRPLLTMLVFTVVFGRMAKFQDERAPYAVVVFAALLPWQLFASGMTEAGNSLTGNAALITKVYFPRLMLPLSGIAVSLIDFAISLLLLGALMAVYGYVPDWHLAALPVFLALALLAATGASIWCAALNVRYRDFRYVVPFVVQLGLYASPVGFTSDRVPEAWRWLFSLNPMVGVIDGFRWALLRGSPDLYWPGVAGSALCLTLLGVSGLYYFRRTEKTFADLV